MNAPVVALAFAPDGKTVVAGSQAGLAAWPWPALASPKRQPPTMDNIHGLAFSPDGRRLAVAGGVPGERGVVEVRAWPSLAVEFALPAGKDVAYAAAWRDDGAALLVAGGDGVARLFAAKAGAAARSLEGHSRAARGAAFVAGVPVTGAADGTLRVWNADSGAPTRTLSNHTDAIHALAPQPAAPGLLASCGGDRTVRWWQPALGRMVRFVRLPSEPLALAWSADGAVLAAACRDGQVRELDPAAATVRRTLPAFTGPAFAIAAAPGGGWCVGGERDSLRRV